MANIIPRLKYEFAESIKGAEISYLFGKEIAHGKSINKIDWSVFEPTKFIYMYLTYNMIYDFEWPNVNLKNPQNVNFKIEKKIESYVSQKIKRLNNFLIENNENFSNKFKEKLISDKNSNTIEGFKDSINEIQNENNKTRLKKLIEKNSSFTNSDLKELLIYIDSIRNNIFHGNKEVQALLKPNQLNRLKFYTLFLDLYLDIFFDTIEKTFENYNRVQLSELSELLN
jgi:hypothetical protein